MLHEQLQKNTSGESVKSIGFFQKYCPAQRL